MINKGKHSTPSLNQSPEDALVSSKAGEGVREMFTSISPTYDFLNHLLSLNIDRYWRRILAKATMKPGVEKVLDVCGGTGDLGLALRAQAVRIDLSPYIICSDFTPAMTAIASRKFRNSSTRHSTLPVTLVADTTGLPFADETFDLVTVAFGIRNVADPNEGLREMTRVCKAGGQIAVLEFSKTNNRVIDKAFSLYFSHILPAIGRAVTGTRAYHYLSKSVESFPEGERFSKMVSSATGTETEARKLSCGIATLYLSRKKKSPLD